MAAPRKPVRRRPAFKEGHIPALRVIDPAAWVREVTKALREADWFIGDAALTLGVSRRSLQRWIHEDERLARVRSFIAGPGRPPKN